MKNKLKEFILFIKSILEKRELIFSLSKNDFKIKYAGSYFGVLWAFVQPLVTIGVFWFVFQVGFKNPPVQDVPFILWLICGIIPWFYFSEALNNATNSLIEYSFLVQKVVFRTSILPIVKIISSWYVHIFFVIFIFIMFLIYGYGFSIYNIQIIYYIFALVILLLGLSWIASSIVLFFKDVRQIINIILQIGFWLTPIFWDYKVLPNSLLEIFKINPMFYIVQGYRDTFINHIWFWERPLISIIFWIEVSLLIILGANIFRKLRPHFPDVL